MKHKNNSLRIHSCEHSWKTEFKPQWLAVNLTFTRCNNISFINANINLYHWALRELINKIEARIENFQTIYTDKIKSFTKRISTDDVILSPSTEKPPREYQTIHRINKLIKDIKKHTRLRVGVGLWERGATHTNLKARLSATGENRKQWTEDVRCVSQRRRRWIRGGARKMQDCAYVKGTEIEHSPSLTSPHRCQTHLAVFYETIVVLVVRAIRNLIRLRREKILVDK